MENTNIKEQDEKPLDKMNRISKELKMLSDVYKMSGDNDYHNSARRGINKKYGKFWREDLKRKITISK